MREEAFDRIIQNKLNELNQEFLPQDWADMADSLDHAFPEVAPSSHVVNENDFDALIHNKIADFKVEESPDLSWKLLSNQMFDSFDSSMEETLSDYEVPYDPASWEDMVEHLEKPFYRTLRSKLTNVRVAFQARDWKIMRARLNKELPVETPQFDGPQWQVYAVAASLAFLLVFLPLWQQRPGLDGSKEFSQKVSEIPSENVLPQDETNITGLATENPSQLSQLEKEEYKSLELQSSIDPQEVAYNSNTIDSQSPTIQPIENSIKSLVSAPAGIEESIVINQEFTKSTSSDLLEESLATAATYEEVPELIIPLERETKGSLLRKQDLLPVEAVRLREGRNKFNPEFLLGINGGTTSSMAELNDKGEPGFLAGVRVEVRFTDQLSFVSGIQYAEKSFSHLFTLSETLNNASGARRVSQVNEAAFSTMELPALVRLRLPSDEKNSLYIQSGLVSFFMINESYRRYDPTSAQNADIVVPVGDPKDLNFTNHKLNFTTYIANLHAAIGYERRLSDRILFQLEPYFQMGLQKMGPPSANAAERNNLYTGGIGAGIIYDFGVKNRKSKARPPKIF